MTVVIRQLRDHREAFDATLEQENKAFKTIEAYDAAIEQFTNWLETKGDPPDDLYGLQRDHVRDWIIYMQKLGRSESTVANRYRGLKAFFNFVEEEMEGMDRKREFLDPMRKMSMPKVHEIPVPVIPPVMIEKLLATCKERTFENDRDAAIIALLYSNGIRKSELRLMLVEKMEFTSKTYWVLGKGGKWRPVPMLPMATRFLMRYKTRREGHPYADQPGWWLGRKGPLGEGGLRTMLTRRGAIVGLPDLHPHMFRHTWAHEMRLGGCPDDELMRLAGWEGRDMLHRYSASAGQARAIAAGRTYDIGAKLSLPR